MSTTISEPAQPAPSPSKTNRIGLEFRDYKGLASTLCAGCGHDAITASIVHAFFEMGVAPHRVAKLSGIGCSSKTTAYFLHKAHGFNAVHGRMSAIATGVALANRTLINVGVSGDGDTASIGLGNFLHMVRRNVPILYIVENNGCYGLTKGQFSATADIGSSKKDGLINAMPPMDCCALAVTLGCGFVARSFSGDVKQVRALIQAAIAYRGTAIIDILSPCVTFNNHEGSTKSYDYAKEHEDPLHDIDFIPYFEDITVDYAPGTTTVVEMHDGSRIRLKKLDRHYDPTNRSKAMQLLGKAHEDQLFITGLLYFHPEAKAIDEQENLVDEPLATLPDARVRPGPQVFDQIMRNYQ